jgi:hypothetical protein
MGKKVKFLVATSLVIGMSVVPKVTTFATTAATSSDIKVVVTQDDAKTAVTGLTATLVDQNGVDESTIAPASGGTYDFPGVSTNGTFTVVLSNGAGQQESVPVTSTTFGTHSVNAVWMNKVSTKSGVIGGIAVDGSDNPVAGVTVKAYNSTTTWATVSNSNGEYKLYVPAGTYTLVTEGQNSSYTNIETSVTVTAGEMSGAAVDQDAETAWSSGTAYKLGYIAPTVAAGTKTIAGTVNPGCTVAAYAYSNGAYTFLGTTTAAATGKTAGQYTITLNAAVTGGETIAIRVTDPALNVYEDDSVTATSRSMTLTAAPSTGSTAANIASPFTITCVDSSSPTTMNSTLASNITSVTAKLGSNLPITLVNGTDYTVSSGKITFNTRKLLAGTYTITVNATGYNTATVSQTIAASTTAAPALSGIFTAVPGSAVGSTKFTTIGTAADATDDILVYKIVTSASTTPDYKGNALSGTYYSLAANTNISAVNPNTFIDIYEINSTTKAVVSTKRITLTSANILAPSIKSAVVNGNTITLTTDPIITSATGTPANGAFAVTVGSKTNVVTGVSVSGTSITLTLTSAVKISDAVTVIYTKPSSNYLQDQYGNAVASLSKAISASNDTGAPTGVSVSLAGNADGTATATISGTSTLEQYSVNGGSTWANCTGTSETVTIPTTGNTAGIEVRTAATNSDIASVATTAFVVSAQAAAPTVQVNVSAGTITGTSSLEEYSLDGGATWNPCIANTTSISVPTNGATIEVRTAGTTTALASVATTPIVVSAQAAAPTVAVNVGEGIINGTSTLEEYSVDGGTTWNPCTATITAITVGIPTDGTGSIEVRTAGTTRALASLPTTAVSVAQQGNAPKGLTLTSSGTGDGTNGTISGTDATMQYSTDGGITWTTCSATSTSVTIQTTGINVLVRYAGSSTTLGSATTSLSVSQQAGAPPVTVDVEAGTITGTDATMEYTTDGGANWTTCSVGTTSFTASAAQIIEVRYAATSSSIASATTTPITVAAQAAVPTASSTTSAVEVTGLNPNQTGLQYCYAPNGSTYGSWTPLAVDGNGDATISETGATAGTSTVQIRVAGNNSTLDGKVQTITVQ